MVVKVKWDDIRHGTRVKGHDCMVARAIKRELPQGTFVHVGSGVSIGTDLRLPLPAFVRGKISAFDRHRWVLPFQFELKGI